MSSDPLKGLDPKYFRSFRIGNLYYRFIKGTELETQGWTAERISQVLVAAGYIQLLTTQKQDTRGRFGMGQPRYIELPGKQISAREFHAMIKTQT